MSCADLDALYKRAKYACEICRLPEPSDDPLNIDHEPWLGDYAVRGLLCRSCNGRLGPDGERHWSDPDVLRYLGNAWWARPGGPRPLGRARFAWASGSDVIHIVGYPGVRLIGDRPERTECGQTLAVPYGVQPYRVDDSRLCEICVLHDKYEMHRLRYYRNHPLAFAIGA